MIETTVNEPGAVWNKSRRQIAEAILSAGRPLSPGEVARLTSQDQSNRRRTMEKMVTAGILEANQPVNGRGGRGRKPSAIYALTKSGKAEIEAQIEGSQRNGLLRQGDQLVLASFSGLQSVELDETIDALPGGSGLAWTASLDGGRQERMIVFGGENGLKKAEQLMASLKALGVECHRVTVSEVSDGLQALADARRSTEAVRTALERRAARHATL